MQEASRQLELAVLDAGRRSVLLRGVGARRQQRAGEQRRRAAAALLAACLSLACAGAGAPPADLVAAAIQARGGPLEGFTRESRLVVHYGFPGRWHWEIAFQRPDRFRLTLHTTGDAQSFASDGTTLRTYLGSALVAEEPAGGACARSLARWLAVVTLDELPGSGFRWRELPPEAVPAGAARALEARCAVNPASRYVLRFDRALRLVSVSGPITIPTLGDSRLEARFSDYREVGGLRLPFRIDYELDGEPFLEESIVAFHRGAPALAEARRSPSDGRSRHGRLGPGLEPIS